MKRFICIIMLIILILAISSCSLLKMIENPEENNSLTINKPGDLIDSFHTVNITKERLEIKTSLGFKYVFNGIEIQEDNGVNAETTNNLLKGQIENNNLCPTGETNLEIQFSDVMPRSVTWYNNYYMDLYNGFIYSDLQQMHTIDNVNASVVLPIGIDIAVPLNANYPSDKHYRIIRIVCDFDTQKVEYYIFINS